MDKHTTYRHEMNTHNENNEHYSRYKYVCLFSARLHIQYPMLFKLTNKKKNRETHCGVLEFVADEGRIYIPYWVCIYHYHHGICFKCYPHPGFVAPPPSPLHPGFVAPPSSTLGLCILVPPCLLSYTHIYTMNKIDLTGFFYPQPSQRNPKSGAFCIGFFCNFKICGNFELHIYSRQKLQNW